MKDIYNEFDKEKIKYNKSMSNNFEFPINISDLIFVLTRNNSIYPNSINNMISKSIIFKDLTNINLDMFSDGLSLLKIDKLNLIVISDTCHVNTVNIVK